MAKQKDHRASEIRTLISRIASLIVAASALAIPGLALAQGDPGTTMAPPISQTPYDADTNSSSTPSAASASVFNWQEVPANQNVPLTRAVFDQAGYQLFDTAGETIVVPFKHQNLYVMKFAVSTTGQMYFVNTGTAPTLYVQRGGYLENATVAGARWYPFSKDYHPHTPVYLGIAPSWSDYHGMGWYPNMFYYGGYWGATSVGIFTPSLGLSFVIGGQRYAGWGGYQTYISEHPGFVSVGVFHPAIYHYARRAFWSTRTFHVNTGSFAGHGFNGGHAFYGAGHPSLSGSRSSGRHSFGGAGYNNSHGHGYGNGHPGGYQGH